MKVIGGDWIIAMDTPDRDDLVDAINFALSRIEGEIEGAAPGEDLSAHRRHRRLLLKFRSKFNDD